MQYTYGFFQTTLIEEFYTTFHKKNNRSRLKTNSMALHRVFGALKS